MRADKPSSEDAKADSGPKADQAKTSEEILAEEIVQGLAELRRRAPGLLLSGFSAGLDVGFSVFFMGILLTLLDPGASPLFTRLMLANMYSVGFIFVILGRSELFTEHTTLAVFPVLGGHASLGQLGRLWGLVYVANLVGAAVFALFVTTLGPRMDVISVEAFGEISQDLLRHDSGTIFMSAVAAGWLMGLLSWLVTASQETLARVFVVWLITAGIGFAGLHHSIVGSVEVLAGVLTSADTGLADFGRFLLWSTLGNVVGGVALVAALKYSHAVRSR
ncbi:MAG TPA: formate/nitrite transporter family protein [Longimicrobiales bacterium]|nr:formate/nitrite transporter family protein [Longimicrobiales bacterium]